MVSQNVDDFKEGTQVKLRKTIGNRMEGLTGFVKSVELDAYNSVSKIWVYWNDLGFADPFLVDENEAKQESLLLLEIIS